MSVRIKTIYMWLTIPLLAWLLFAQAELRSYRQQSVAFDVHGFHTHLQIAESSVVHGLEAYDSGDVAAGGFWLEDALQNLEIADAFARSYSPALNRRFSSIHWGFGYLSHPETSPQRHVLAQVRAEATKEAVLRPQNRVLL